MTAPFRIGTRGSRLALQQSRTVADLIVARHPELAVELVVIRTEGDRTQHLTPQPFADRGVFVREIEHALLTGSVDLAVHSMKDLPATLPSGLEIAAVPQRADPRDVLHVRDSSSRWEALPAGARIGTSSQRRTAQLRHCRPDLDYQPIRGNVETRIAKVDRGDYDVAVLAAAGLERLDLLGAVSDYLPMTVCLPEAGQGALALEIRSDAARVRDLVSAVDHAMSRRATEVERGTIALLGGGCSTPTACYAVFEGGDVWVRAVVCSPDGARLLSAEVRLPTDQAEAAPAQLARVLLANGAAALLSQEQR